MKYQIIPSIIAKNQKELNQRLQKVFSLSNIIQLDVMDGKFVKDKSLNFNFKLPRQIRSNNLDNSTKSNNPKVYEAHLMMKNPLYWIKKNASKVDIIIVHIESDDVEEAIKLIKGKNKRLGIALNPKTPVNAVIPLLKKMKINYVTILSVNTGRYGAKFIPPTLNKVKQLKEFKSKNKLKFNIEIDGGLGVQHIVQAKRAGANIFISGSYLQSSNNVKGDYERLKKLIK